MRRAQAWPGHACRPGAVPRPAAAELPPSPRQLPTTRHPAVLAHPPPTRAPPPAELLAELPLAFFVEPISTSPGRLEVELDLEGKR